MLLDRPNWPSHRPWFLVVASITLAAIAWFAFEGLDSTDWPGGSTVPGFTFGILGGLIILFECALWVRKQVRAWRIGSAQIWLRAHIWLGLLCLPLLVLHSGFRMGGWLTTVLMTLLVIVVVSGIIGVVFQNIVPKHLLEETPSKTVWGQLDALSAQLAADAELLISATCGSIDERAADAKHECRVAHAGLSVHGRALVTATAPIAIADAAPLAAFFREQVSPYLHWGAAGSASLADAGQAALCFQDIRLRIPNQANAVLVLLESYCDQRRQWDRQARLHTWLHAWLWIHFPLAVALVVLMLLHVVVALKYW